MKRLDVKRKLSAKSERVKAVDVHPKEPWVLSALYDGKIFIWNYMNRQLVKSFEASTLPVRCGAFIARKSWVVAGCDDMHLRVYNYNTLDKVTAFEAHQDYIRAVAVHPSQPFVLSSSDDMLIKLWDWEKGWQCTRVFEGHSHYVMQLSFNPKDPNVFASASLDRTIKVWSLGSNDPNFTLEGHEKGVNCVSYYPGGDKPYIVSGADDFTLKVWDYQNKKCVHTMEGHTNNVTVVGFHPSLPVIVSGSEDATVRLWHADTYRLEKTLNYGFDRVWALGFLKGSNIVALGYDDGTVVIKIGSENPCISMDHAGKIIWTQQMEVQQANLQRLESEEIADGERLPLITKDLGRTELYPHALRHNANGRFVAVVGDGDFVIYTALAWRQKSFGSGLDFVWSHDPNEYAVRESASRIKVFRSFKEKASFRPPFSAEGIFGGTLLAIRSTRFVCLYDWEHQQLIRRIDVTPKQIYWSESGEMLTIACEASFFILKFNRAVVEAAGGHSESEEGIEGAFDVLHEVSERVVTAAWVGDCFVYTTASNRLQYSIGPETVTVAHLDGKMYLLGYLPKLNKLFLADKSMNVTAYTLHVSIINYQTAVLRGDMEAAQAILPTIPADHHERISQFLEAQGHKEAALDVCSDPDRKFELAVSLDRLDIAADIAAAESSDYKWKQLADLALAQNNLPMAEKALQRAEDVNGLLLLYLATANGVGLERLSAVAAQKGKNNVAFATLFVQGRVEECLALLCQTHRYSEAALMARTYRPSLAPAIVTLWKQHLAKKRPKEADRIADPKEFPNLFGSLSESLVAEQMLAATSQKRSAGDYPAVRDAAPRDVLQEGQAWYAQQQQGGGGGGGKVEESVASTTTTTTTPQKPVEQLVDVVEPSSPAPQQESSAPAPEEPASPAAVAPQEDLLDLSMPTTPALPVENNNLLDLDLSSPPPADTSVAEVATPAPAADMSLLGDLEPASTPVADASADLLSTPSKKGD